MKITLTKEIAVRQAAARHLRGMAASQNLAAIAHAQTKLAYEEIVARFGADEIARCDALEPSVDWAAV